MSWLLDTCVLSEYVKKAPAPGVITLQPLVLFSSKQTAPYLTAALLTNHFHFGNSCPGPAWGSSPKPRLYAVVDAAGEVLMVEKRVRLMG